LAAPSGLWLWQPPGAVADNEIMSDLPRRAVTRTAKLATLPVGLAGRTALGLGKRIGGKPAELVAREIQQRTAEQIFRVLGELKGGALKLGQALSIFEAALPPDLAGPYRATLTRLQESAPPLPAASVHRVLAADLGASWRDSFLDFDDTPAAAASIGQVHRAVWRDGREVAVKIQYPGAGKALISDFTQLSRIGKLFGVLMPGLDVGPLLDELRARVAEELDYLLEASSQEKFADAYAGDPDIYVPHVVAATEHVLVSEWMDGMPLSQVIAKGTPQQRNRAGILIVRLLFSGPARVGLLHADPHPGNFRLLADGRLGVIDFGAVDRLPDGFPRFFGTLLRLTHEDNGIETVEQLLRDNGFLKRGVSVDLRALRAYLAPLAEPSRVDSFKFSREWMRSEAARVTDMRSAAVGRRLNLPPSYVLIHRVSTAGIGVLCQLECEGAFRAEVLKWMPGYLDETEPGELRQGPADQLADRQPEEADRPPDETAGTLDARELSAAGLDAGKLSAADLDAGELSTADLDARGLSAADPELNAAELDARKLGVAELDGQDLSADGRVTSETAGS
jgi:predicted unusual protein kinase regulating ubiquinone biosynthesis (AarF/ABC1/UbiB family)